MSKWLGRMVVIAGMCWAPVASAATYKLDPDHSSVEFKIRHLFSYVHGEFTEFEGTYEYEPGKPETWKARAVMQTASIDTKAADRDEHLRSADFFDAATYPTITFTSTQVTDVTSAGAKLHGILNIHGVEKPVVMDVAIHGEGKDPWGKTRSGFTATVTVDRKDFGLMWNKVVEAGQMLVGDEVQITIEVEGIRQE